MLRPLHLEGYDFLIPRVRSLRGGGAVRLVSSGKKILFVICLLTAFFGLTFLLKSSSSSLQETLTDERSLASNTSQTGGVLDLRKDNGSVLCAENWTHCDGALLRKVGREGGRRKVCACVQIL